MGLGSRQRRHVVLVGFDGMQLLDIVGPADLLHAATQLLGGRGGYDITTTAVDDRPIVSSSGMRLAIDMPLARVRPSTVDTVIVGGGMHFEAAVADARLTLGVSRLARAACRVCSVCTGAFVLGRAGLLDRREATTHWAWCQELARRHPRTHVSPDRIFVRDGPVVTAAGMTAGMDLALALIEEDHGPRLARSAARWTVMFLQRPGGQSQFSERLALPPTMSVSIRGLIDSIVEDPAADHRIEQLARRAAMSERHLRRVFVAETHVTPARFVERVRVEAACELLEASTANVEVVTTRAGFGSTETMRRAFVRVIGIGPSDYRARFRSTQPAQAAA